MTDAVFSVDKGSGACSLKELIKYPDVTSPDGSITVTPTTDANGKTTYQVRVAHDVNMDVAGFDPETMILTMVETDGDTFTVNLNSLTSNVTNTIGGHLVATHTSGNGVVTDIRETVTGIARSGSELVYTDESGAATNISLCSLVSSVATSAIKIGG